MKEKQFADSMAYLGLAYNKEYSKEEIMQYYDFLGKYNDNTLIQAIKNLIRKSKFLPKINELIEECESCKEQIKIDVIEFMKIQGYFKDESEYTKTIHFMEEGIVPNWLQEDINKYYKMMRSERLEQKDRFLIEG